MENKKQSSIEWLIEQVKKEHPFWTDTFEQAKAMHKKEIIDTFFEGAYGGDIISGEQYYNETYKGGKQ